MPLLISKGEHPQTSTSLFTMWDFEKFYPKDLWKYNDGVNVSYKTSRASPKCYKCPKKHIGPTIWFHSIKLKLFKLIFINRFNDLFLLFSKMTVLRNQNKAREEPESWILKSFNLIEWNQIVGPVCFFNIWETFWL